MMKKLLSLLALSLAFIGNAQAFEIPIVAYTYQNASVLSSYTPTVDSAVIGGFYAESIAIGRGRVSTKLTAFGNVVDSSNLTGWTNVGPNYYTTSSIEHGIGFSFTCPANTASIQVPSYKRSDGITYTGKIVMLCVKSDTY